jgi:hypothetical protein
MATEKVFNPVERIEVLTDGSIQVREATSIQTDGAIDPSFPPKYHRYVLHPGDDLTGKDPRIVAVATSVWTDDVLSDHKARLAALAEFTPQVSAS